MKHMPKIIPDGDSGMLMKWEQDISPEITEEVGQTVRLIRSARIEGITDLVPAYCSLMICYDPAVILWNSLYERVVSLLGRETDAEEKTYRTFEIPVLYGGPDTARVTEHTGLSEEELIRLHSGTEYLVHMIGFLPGFPYLGGLDERLAVPRLQEPRLSIPAGSVGIGGSQTGIYPLSSPGGWNIIGSTPVRLYDPRQAEPVLLRTGDRIRFAAVTEEEYERISADIQNGKKGYRVREGDGQWAYE